MPMTKERLEELAYEDFWDYLVSWVNTILDLAENNDDAKTLNFDKIDTFELLLDILKEDPSFKKYRVTKCLPE
jgi:predicted nucleotidyltransferase